MDHLHTAWAETTIDKNLIGQQAPDFEEWVKNELAKKIFSELRGKIHYHTEREKDGGVTYTAWITWYDDEAAMIHAKEDGIIK